MTVSHRDTVQIAYSELPLEAFNLYVLATLNKSSDLITDSFLKALLHLRVLGKAVKN